MYELDAALSPTFQAKKKSFGWIKDSKARFSGSGDMKENFLAIKMPEAKEIQFWSEIHCFVIDKNDKGGVK